MIFEDIKVLPKHRSIGLEAFFAVSDANGDDPGTRDAHYEIPDIAWDRFNRGQGWHGVMDVLSYKQRPYLFGWVIESAALDHYGFGDQPRVNKDGRDGEADARFEGLILDFKYTGGADKYGLVVSKDSVAHEPPWCYVFYNFKGTLLGWGTGYDFRENGVEPGTPPFQEMPRAGTSRLNLSLPLGYNL